MVAEKPDEVLENYAWLRAFAACVDGSDAAVRDAAELPCAKKELELILFMSFAAMGSADEVKALKGLATQLGSFLDLSEKDRRAIAALKTFEEAKRTIDERTRASLAALMAADFEHYKVVLGRAIRSLSEMKYKVDAFDTHHNVTGRFNAHS